MCWRVECRGAGEQGSRGAGGTRGQGDKGNFSLLPSAFCFLPFPSPQSPVPSPQSPVPIHT
ncbi:hypothetical protein NIES2119_03100 [[Phormidium ambiguum] IAM M-71]|uniref:Uncharacterized protein n=1 Tax=[Phormidium ambiguum] IAM M-71 TaxID=454136 RepID=A0A1U7IS77_9CYAN|nr:hypothetical protein NIES2119_03100 [Phormidium ambiguum IAM M-71]